MDINEQAQQFLKRFLDDRQFTWVFDSSHPSPFLTSSLEIGDHDFTIHVVDNFGGLQPVLFHKETVGKEEMQIPFRPSAILDSNIVSALVQFVSSRPPLSSSRQNIVLEFLRFLVKHGLDYNPFFYFMEGYWKDHSPDFLDYAAQTSRAILTLHCMNTAHFLQRNEIVIDDNILTIYAREYAESSFDQIAIKHAQAMTVPVDQYSKMANKASYASLLKMSVIHKTSVKSISQKYSDLTEFMAHTLHVVMGAERALSLGYFAGLYDDFIPMQRGANADRVLRRIQAASWDLFLVRLPVDLLARSGEHGIVLGYLCTADRTLAQIAKTFTVHKIISGFSPNSGYIPIQSCNFDYLRERVGSEVIHKILAEDAAWQKQRVSQYAIKSEPISEDDLTTIIAALEKQVRRVCSE